MTRHFYRKPVVALSLATLALAGCAVNRATTTSGQRDVSAQSRNIQPSSSDHVRAHAEQRTKGSSQPPLPDEQLAARNEVDRVVNQFVTLVDEARRAPDGLTFQLFLRVMKLQPKTSRGDPMLENYGASFADGWTYILGYSPQEKTGKSGFLMFLLEDPVNKADRKKRSPRITVCSDFGRLAEKLIARGFTSYPAGNDWVFDDRDTRNNFWINVLTSREFDTRDLTRDPSEERECVREIYVSYIFKKK